jgi:hypothetical protein
MEHAMSWAGRKLLGLFEASPFSPAYWFGPNFELSFCICRSALGLMYLFTFYKWSSFNFETYFSGVNPANYRPLGLFLLLGNEMPPQWVFQACYPILGISSVFLILGFLTRLSLLGCILSLIGVSQLFYGFEIGWSHGFSPLIVTSIPMLLGPRERYGLDGIIRRWFGWQVSVQEQSFARTAVLLSQISIAAVFLNAACFKLHAYGEGLRYFLPWALSDNLRNVIIRQHIVLNKEMNPFFAFIVSHPWAYQGMALGNLFCQSIPMVGCLLVRRPVLRFACGFFMCLEVLGLGIVMGIWNPHWLLFLTLFVDWDRLLSRYIAPTEVIDNTNRTISHCVRLAAVAAFVSINFYVMAFHRSQHAWSFPFTSYPMFSDVVAYPPYRQHQQFYLPVSRYEFDAEKPMSEASLRRNWAYNWGMTWITNYHPQAVQMKGMMEADNHVTLTGIRAYRDLMVFPLAPEYLPRPVASALVYELKNGTERHISSVTKYDAEKRKAYIEFNIQGVSNPAVRFKRFSDDWAELQDLDGTLIDGRFYYVRPQSPNPRIFVVIETTDESTGEVIRFAGPLI